MKPVFKVITQGNVEFSGSEGYLFLGNEDVVCFYIDPVDRGYVEAYTTNEEDCPVLYVSDDEDDKSTVIEFPEFPSWKVHSTHGGKSIAVTLVRCAAYHKVKQ